MTDETWQELLEAGLVADEGKLFSAENADLAPITWPRRFKFRVGKAD